MGRVEWRVGEAAGRDEEAGDENEDEEGGRSDGGICWGGWLGDGESVRRMAREE